VILYFFSSSCIEKMFVIPLGMYHVLMEPYFPIRLVITVPALQLILIPASHFLILFRYLLDLNAVMVEHPPRYALLSGSAAPCARVTYIS
jgi:hypothetical protein